MSGRAPPYVSQKAGVDGGTERNDRLIGKATIRGRQRGPGERSPGVVGAVHLQPNSPEESAHAQSVSIVLARNRVCPRPGQPRPATVVRENEDKGHVEELLAAFEAEVWARRGELVGQPDADGFRRIVAAALLFRGLELLGAARACNTQMLGPAGELVLRTAVEVALRGRFLLSPDGGDELFRMTVHFLKHGAKTAAGLQAEFGGVGSEFLAAVGVEPAQGPLRSEMGEPSLPVGSKRPRDLFAVAQALDARAGLGQDDNRSAVRIYRMLYGPLSDSVVHGGLAALRRFTELREGLAVISHEPQPLTSGRRFHVIVGGLLGDLAREVFVAFDLPTSRLDEIGIHWSCP